MGTTDDRCTNVKRKLALVTQKITELSSLFKVGLIFSPIFPRLVIVIWRNKKNVIHLKDFRDIELSRE